MPGGRLGGEGFFAEKRVKKKKEGIPMKNQKTNMNVQKAPAPQAGAWKRWLLAGSALGAFGCGDLDYNNYVPLPSKRDSSLDFRVDLALKPDSSRDLSANDSALDAAGPDGNGAKDGAAMDGKGKDAQAVDSGPADACIAQKSALSCSNTSTLASGWLSLGGSLDLKGGPLPLQTVYKLRLDGIETLGGSTSAAVSVTDSCGKSLKKDKVAVGATKTFVLNGNAIFVTADEVYGGLSALDASAQTGLAKISVTVPCNLDMGLTDAKLSDYKVAPLDSYKPDMPLTKPDMAKPDSKPAPDSAKPDSAAKADAKQADSGKADAQKPDAKKLPDASAASDIALDTGPADAWPSCSLAATGSFSDQIFAGTPKAVGGYTFDYKGKDASGNVLFDISCGSSPLVSGMAFPPYQKTTIPVPADGKVIYVTPHTSTSGWVDVRIDVKNP
jgi:hypothetical protein